MVGLWRYMEKAPLPTGGAFSKEKIPFPLFFFLHFLEMFHKGR